MPNRSHSPGSGRALIRILAAVALVGTVLAGCGSGATESEQAGGGGKAEPNAFPVTIPHAFGQTTLEREPVRVVSVGNTDQDAVLALGVVPVATTEWYGKLPGAVHPWAIQALGDAPPPEVLTNTDGIQFERIAALQPDLILGTYAGLTQTDYDTLSRIAPTVAQPPGVENFKATWQQQTEIIGKALGQPTKAQELVRGVEQRFTDAKAQHPEFAGKSAISAQFGQGTFRAWSSGDARGNLLTQLGFRVPPQIDQIAGSQASAPISNEQVGLLDVDALVLGVANIDQGKAEAAANPLFNRLPTQTEGRTIYYQFGATPNAPSGYFTVLSMPVVLDRIVPELAAAVDGNPASPIPNPPVI